MTRNTLIDSLKGIAMCAVIMIHSGCGDLSTFIGTIGRMGRNGVQLFLIITTILTFLSLERLYSNNGVTKFLEIKWIIKRFIYLMPLYYLAIFLYANIGGAPYWYGDEGHVTICNILSHLTFTHGLFPHYADSIIGAEWYLGVIAVFYIFAPAFYKLVNSLEKSVIFTVGSIVLCNFIYEFSMNCLMPETNDAYIYSNYFGAFSFFAQLPVIALGINTFYILKFDMSKVTEKGLLSYVLLIFTLIMLWGHANNANSLYLMSTDTIFGVWCVILIISQSIRSTFLINNVFFRIIGRYSYPIYLFHLLIIYIYGKYCNFAVSIRTINWLIKYIIVIGISLLVAIVMEKFIDVPFRKIVNKLIKC